MKTLKALAIGTVPVVGLFACLLLFQLSSLIQRTSLNEYALVAQTAEDEHAIALQAVQTLRDVDKSASDLEKAATPAVVGLRSTEGKLNATIDLTSHRINDLCPDPKAVDAAIHPCGTLADADRTLATLRGSSGQLERSMLVFNQHEGDLFTQESAAYAELQKSVSDFDAAVTNPDLATMVHSGAAITTDAAAVTHDGRTWIHQKLFPTKKKGFVSGFEATGDVAKHWMPSIF
jgi:hypothetical protein